MNTKIKKLIYDFNISRRRRALLRRRELVVAGNRYKRLETRFSHFALSPKPLLVIGALMIALQPLLVSNINSAGAASNPALALTGYIWENEDGSSPDTVSQITAADGTIEAPWGSRINLRAQLKNTGDALSDTDLGLFYDKGDGFWNKVNSSDKKTNTTALPQVAQVAGSSGDFGQYLDIEVDSEGSPWMSYFDNGFKNLVVAKFVSSGGSGCEDSSAWDCTTIDSTGDVGRGTSLTIGGNNDPWISYWDSTSANLKVAHYVGSGGTGCDVTDWDCSTVDSGTDVGEFSSIALKSDAEPWVSYYDDANDSVKLAKYVGSGGSGCAITSWSCETIDSIGSTSFTETSIAFDSEGAARMSYAEDADLTSGTDLVVAKYVGSGGTGCNTTAWDCDRIFNGYAGTKSSMVIDHDGSPWVSFIDGQGVGQDALVVAHYVGSSGTGCDNGITDWTCEIVENDITNDYGVYTSIDIDSKGVVWVAHKDGTDDVVRVAKYVGSGGTGCVGGITSWKCTAAGIKGGNHGVYVGIALDNKDNIWIGSHEGDNGELYSIKLSDWPTGGGCDNNAFASAWECGDVATSGKGRQPDMALDNSGNPWISYYNSGSGYLDVAKYVGSGGTGCASDAWQCESVEYKGYTDGDTSIAFDSGGMPWISYNHNSTSGDLYVAHYVGGTGGSCTNSAWECDAVDTAAALDATDGNSTSIAIDQSNVAWVSYLDTSAGTLKVAKYVGSGGSGCNDSAWTCTTVEGANSNGHGSSIAISPDNEAWVSFYSEGSTPEQELQVAKYVGSGGSGCNSSAWTCSDVFTRDLQNQTEIVFDAEGAAWIGFKEGGTYDKITAAKYVGSGGSGCYGGATDWECVDIDTADNVGKGLSVAMSPEGKPWFSYQDETADSLKIANYVGSGGIGCGDGSPQWSCHHIKSGIGGSGIHSTMAFDHDGSVWVSYFDSSGVDLRYVKLSRSGEILLAPAQRYTNGAAISESHADMTSVTDTTNRDDADCIGSGTWNNGKYFNSNSGSGISLPIGSTTAQCTEVVFTLDLSQAEIGDNYRFMIATKDSWDSNKSVWRGLSGGGTPPELSITDVSFISGKDNSVRLPDCDADPSIGWGCAELDASGSGTDDLQYPKIVIDSEGNPWATWEDEVNESVVVANYVGSGGTGCSTTAWHCEDVADAGPYGGFSAIAAGEDGSIWVSYYDNVDTALAAAKYVGSSGSCNAAGWGNVHIGNGSDAWDCTTVDDSSTVGRNVGERTDIAMDSYGNPWISYYDTSADNLKVANYVGSDGNCDDGSLTGSDAWNCETVDETGDSGRYSSIAVSGDNDVWIMQHDHSANGNDNLRVAHYVGTGGDCTSDAWDCKILDDTAGEYGGIAIDNEGNPWVSYRNNVSVDLMVANYVGTGGSGCYTGVTDWSCVKVDTSADTAYQSSIAIAADGNPWVTYSYSTTGQLRLSKYVGSGGDCDDIYGGDSSDAWDCSTIEDTGSVGQMPYIAFDLSGNAWIAHKDGGNNSIRIAKTHRPTVPLSTDNNLRVKARSAGNGFARYLSSFGKANANNPGICNGISDYYGACGLFSASGDYDTITAQANESPYWTFAQRFDSNSELPTPQWEGTSSLAPSTSGTSGDIKLQVYRYGTTNAWEDVTSDTTSSSCSATNCRLEGTPTGTTSEYFKTEDGKYWVYFRLFQEPSTSSTVTFKTDQFKAATNEQRARHGSYLQDGYKRPLNWR